MNLLESIKEYLSDKEYYLVLYDDYLYLYSKTLFVNVNKNLITIDYKLGSIKILGDKLTILKMDNHELLMTGNIYDIQK